MSLEPRHCLNLDSSVGTDEEGGRGKREDEAMEKNSKASCSRGESGRLHFACTIGHSHFPTAENHALKSLRERISRGIVMKRRPRHQPTRGGRRPANGGKGENINFRQGGPRGKLDSLNTKNMKTKGGKRKIVKRSTQSLKKKYRWRKEDRGSRRKGYIKRRRLVRLRSSSYIRGKMKQ